MHYYDFFTEIVLNGLKIDPFVKEHAVHLPNTFTNPLSELSILIFKNSIPFQNHVKTHTW